MKNYFFNVVLLLCILNSCNKTDSGESLFDFDPERLIRVSSDSSFQMFEPLYFSFLNTPDKYVNYSLLITRSEGENNFFIIGDSLIYRVVCYNSLEHYLSKSNGILNDALIHAGQLKLVKDSVVLYDMNVASSGLAVKYLYEKFKNKHVSVKQQNEFLRNLLIISFLLFMVVFVLRFLGMKEKNHKIELQSRKLNRMKSERHRLKDVIFSGTEIGKKIKSFSLSNPGTKTLLDNPNLITDDDWNEFISEFDVHYNNFTHRLKVRYPHIGANDIRLCCLLKLQRSVSDIALFLKISKDSVIKRKSRLKLDKMNLRNNVDLDEFLRDF
ncbi:hypothetical protein FACS1894155_09390 [Bacteroidia bacterium]|nr:hypothetical protein FACS1894155_09390 [Bacteroidia bacterium]